MPSYWYWVLQRVGSQLLKHGPYRSSQAMENRFDKVSGGQVYKFTSLSDDPKVVEDEFRAWEIKNG